MHIPPLLQKKHTATSFGRHHVITPSHNGQTKATIKQGGVSQKHTATSSGRHHVITPSHNGQTKATIKAAYLFSSTVNE
jgi:hypothetical protein